MYWKIRYHEGQCTGNMIFLKKLTTIVKFLNKTNKVQFVYATVAFLENPVSIKIMQKYFVFKCKTELGSDKYKFFTYKEVWRNVRKSCRTLSYLVVCMAFLAPAHSKPVLQPPRPNHCGNRKCTSKIQTPNRGGTDS